MSRACAQVFGEDCGVGTRSAVGVGSLPMNIPFEVELLLEVDAPATAPGPALAMEAEAKVASMGLSIPPAPKPLGLYRPAMELRKGPGGATLLYVSGHGPMHHDGSYTRGKVGTSKMSAEEAYASARVTGLAVLASLRGALGSLNRVRRVVKSLAMVNAVPEFEGHIGVANGYSELMRDVSARARVPARLQRRWRDRASTRQDQYRRGTA